MTYASAENCQASTGLTHGNQAQGMENALQGLALDSSRTLQTFMCMGDDCRDLLLLIKKSRLARNAQSVWSMKLVRFYTAHEKLEISGTGRILLSDELDCSPGYRQHKGGA